MGLDDAPLGGVGEQNGRERRTLSRSARCWLTWFLGRLGGPGHRNGLGAAVAGVLCRHGGGGLCRGRGMGRSRERFCGFRMIWRCGMDLAGLGRGSCLRGGVRGSLEAVLESLAEVAAVSLEELCGDVLADLLL